MDDRAFADQRHLEPPRCRHGAILLGCADEGCPDQNAYLVINEAAHGLYLERTGCPDPPPEAG